MMTKQILRDCNFENIGDLLRAASGELKKRGVATPRMELKMERKHPAKCASAKAAPRQTMDQRRRHVEELEMEKPQGRKKTFVRRIELAEELLKSGKFDEGQRQKNLANIKARDAYVDLLGRKLLRKIRTPSGRFAE